jgi:hypothetical protein
MIDPISVAALIAGLLGFSAKDIIPELRRHLKTASEEDFRHKRDSVRQHMLVESLVSYYGLPLRSEDPLSGFHLYEVETERRSRVTTAVATKHEWVGLQADLNKVRCTLLPRPAASGDGRIVPGADKSRGLAIWNPRITADRVAKYLALMFSYGSRVYDQDLYRILNVSGFPRDLQVSFALDTFYRYRFGVGLLIDELTVALMEGSLSAEAVVRGRADLLPLREYFLPSPSRFADYQSRVCAGGIQVTFALARSEGDFVIPIQVRSAKVDGGQGWRSIVPMAYHQPMVDADDEVSLESSVFRELFEELFAGEEAEEEVKRLESDWYFEECPALKWLKTNRRNLTLKCTCFGLNLLFGTYDFGILLAVHDPAFWKKFGKQITTNWEIKQSKKIKTKIETESSTEFSGLTSLISDEPWASQGLMSLVEGLTLLKALEPKRVAQLTFCRLLR